MRYELYLRTSEDPASSPPLSREALSEALPLIGIPAEQALPAELDLGQGRLRLEAFQRPADAAPGGPAPDPARLDGINASFPFGLQDAQGDRAVAAVLLLAERLQAIVFDPQLGRLVVRGDHERILANWRRSYDFQLGVVGAAALGAGAPAPAKPDRGAMGTKLKVVLWLGLGILVASFLLRACFDRWMERQWNPPAAGQVEPMAAELPATASPPP